MHEISFSVEQTIKSYSNDEEAWCNAIAGQASAKREENKQLIQETVIEKVTLFELSIIFHLDNPSSKDLDNMIKTVKDTIFSGRTGKKLPTAKLFAINDKYVADLHVHKKSTRNGQKEYTDICVRWPVPMKPEPDLLHNT